MNSFSRSIFPILFFAITSCLAFFTIKAKAQSNSQRIDANRNIKSDMVDNDRKIPTIIINPHDTLGTISKYTYGFNNEIMLIQSAAMSRANRGYDRFNDSFSSKLVQEVKKAHITIMRYPAGTPSNKFNWKKAVGPQSQRGCFDSYWTTTPIMEAYGPTEAMRFNDKIGAEKLDIVVNENTMSPRDAADWVEYMNASVGANPNGGKDWAKVRAANGHPAPYPVTWWEVGNETDGNKTWFRGIKSARERAKAYAFGGTSRFNDQRVGKPCNYIPANSLSDGTPSQVFSVYYPPVIPGSLTLTVGGIKWTQIADLSAADPGAQVYELTDSTGRITFGNGIHGAIPHRLALIKVSYSSGPHAGYVDFYRAMKKVDPNIRVCWGTDLMDWKILKGKPLDCVQRHYYSGNPPASVHSDVSWHDAMMHKADVKGAEAVHDQITLKKSYPHANILATEYGLLNSLKYTNYGKHHQTYKRGYLYSLDNGLYSASMLIDFINAGIPLVNSEDLTSMKAYPGIRGSGTKRWRAFGLSGFGMYPHFITQALGYVVSMFSNLLGSEQVAVKMLSNPQRIPTNHDNKAYPALRVVVAKGNNGKYLTLIVVNRDPKQNITTSIRIKQYHHRTDAMVWTINGTTVTSFNDPTHPKGVWLGKNQIQLGKSQFEYTFAAHSVTAIKLITTRQD